MPLRIAQLSDCHLPENPARLYRGEDADANLRKVWNQVPDWNPDLVFLTGDLSEDASHASYERLRGLVNTTAPILALPGNHDNPAVMQKYFPNGPWNGLLVWETGSWLIIGLDSTWPGKPEGRLSDQSLADLKNILSETKQENFLLALHHQPFPVGAHWIDRYPLKNPEPFLTRVVGDGRIRCVIWGHVHHGFEEQRHGTWWLGAPSTAANCLPDREKFELDERGPSCRTLELGDDGDVQFGQLFADSG